MARFIWSKKKRTYDHIINAHKLRTCIPSLLSPLILKFNSAGCDRRSCNVGAHVWCQNVSICRETKCLTNEVHHTICQANNSVYKKKQMRSSSKYIHICIYSAINHKCPKRHKLLQTTSTFQKLTLCEDKQWYLSYEPNQFGFV